MLNDTNVASAGSYIRTCRRIRNSKKIATIRDFHQNVCVNPTNTRIRLAFTVFGRLLMEPLLHMYGTFDSFNQYLNCISKMYCVLFLCIQQMNGCEPPVSGHCSFTLRTLQFHFEDTAVSLRGHCSNGMVGLVYSA